MEDGRVRDGVAQKSTPTITFIGMTQRLQWEPIKKDRKPVFPLHRLPSWLEDHIKAYAATTGVSEDYCVAAAFGAVSSVIVGHCDIPFNGTHKEPAQLYQAFVGDSGTMKSSVIKHFMNPASEWLQRKNDSARSANYALERKIEGIQKELNKNKSETNQEAIKNELKELLEKKQNLFPVFLNDATPEGLIKSMASSRGTANIASAEGNIINVMIGKSYNQRGSTPNNDIFLSAFDGEPYNQCRSGTVEPYTQYRSGTGGAVNIKRVDLSILIALQPGLLYQFCNSENAVSRGLIQRFLIYSPDKKDIKIDHTIPIIMDEKHVKRWQERIDAIASRFMKPDEKGLEIPIAPDAEMIIREFWNYESELSSIYKYGAEALKGWFAKLHGKALRVSLILSLLQDGDALTNRSDVTISRQAAETAVALFKEYYIPHFIGSYSSEGVFTEEQRKILNHLRTRAKKYGAFEKISYRELYQNLKNLPNFKGRDGSEKFRQGLTELQELNYLKVVYIDKEMHCYINPDFFEEK